MALHPLDLQLGSGEFLSIFGPNGAGKTTLLKVLATLMKPSSGQVRILGLDPSEDGIAVRRQISLVSHSTFLYENLTAYENLLFYGRMYEVENLPKRIAEVFEEVGLTSRQRDLVGSFSDGMQRRLSIARAFLHRPRLLLLDEPYVGLDPEAAHNLGKVLAGLHDGERSLIMTTHNISRGLELCDRAAILVGGRLVYDEVRSAISADDFEATYLAAQHQARAVRPPRRFDGGGP
ncbi:MAG: ABC transporter ATP-binding protein [Candidatus Tectomicrobia bacterium]|nr:ABC transporter ATP-binding protein [Candidatus Tectomicrobia bacterium]